MESFASPKVEKNPMNLLFDNYNLVYDPHQVMDLLEKLDMLDD